MCVRKKSALIDSGVFCCISFIDGSSAHDPIKKYTQVYRKLTQGIPQWEKGGQRILSYIQKMKKREWLCHEGQPMQHGPTCFRLCIKSVVGR